MPQADSGMYGMHAAVAAVMTQALQAFDTPTLKPPLCHGLCYMHDYRDVRPPTCILDPAF